MKAMVTSKGQVTIPSAIRRRLGLEPGQVLDFDENSPYLRAVPVFDEPAMRALVGCTSGRLAMTTDEWLDRCPAQVQADRLAARDRGYLRRYFPDLALLQLTLSGSM